MSLIFFDYSLSICHEYSIEATNTLSYLKSVTNVPQNNRRAIKIYFDIKALLMRLVSAKCQVLNAQSERVGSYRRSPGRSLDIASPCKGKSGYVLNNLHRELSKTKLCPSTSILCLPFNS